MKAKGLPNRDGKFPFGTNWEDYTLLCLIEMGKKCKRAEVEKIDSVVVTASKNAELEKSNEGGGGNVGLGDDTVDDNQEEQE